MSIPAIRTAWREACSLLTSPSSHKVTSEEISPIPYWAISAGSRPGGLAARQRAQVPLEFGELRVEQVDDLQRDGDPLARVKREAEAGEELNVGKLTRQGSAPLRWAPFEAAQSASHTGSPDYHDYHALKARGLTHTRAGLTIARKLARRSYHILHELGPAALDPPDQRSEPAHPSPMRSKHAVSSRSDRGTHAGHRRGGPRKTERPQSLHRNDRSTIKSPATNTRGRGPRQGRASTEPNPNPHSASFR